MSELSPVYEGKVVHAGVFDFKTFYNYLYDWLVNYQYIVIEKKYSEKIKAEGKDVDIEWLCLRKISDYFRFRIKIKMRVIGMASAELVKDGMKLKRDKGEIEISIGSFLERDYENKWEMNAVNKFLRGLYDKYIIKTRVEDYEGALGGEVQEFIAQVKAFLVLEGKR
jgi:hypothetical protein